MAPRKRALDEENPDLATSVLAKDNLLDDINSAVTPILADYLGEHPDDESVIEQLNNLKK